MSSLFLYNNEVKEILEQLDLSYINLTTQIIQNIKLYQKQNDIPNTTNIVLRNTIKSKNFSFTHLQRKHKSLNIKMYNISKTAIKDLLYYYFFSRSFPNIRRKEATKQ